MRTLSRIPKDRRTPSRAAYRCCLEQLEDRCVPSASLVKDINPGIIGSHPEQLIDLNGTLIFRAYDGSPGLWSSDGSEAGTVRIHDASAGDLTKMNGALFFLSGDRRELWKSDGTAAGTVKVTDIRRNRGDAGAYNLTGVGGTLFFGVGYCESLSCYPGTDICECVEGGHELWQSDGTAKGTKSLGRINDLPESGELRDLTDVNGTLYFTAADRTQGRELWRYGATGKPKMVKDINPGAASSDPTGLTDVNGTLYFAATDVYGTATGRELWKSDGTARGTALVKDIAAGGASSDLHGSANVNGTLFFAADDTVNGWELWKSDGTAAGTVLVKDIKPGSAASFPGNLENVNGTLFFGADDGFSGWELWRSDGTASGTMIVTDLRVGSDSSGPQNLTNVNGLLYFSANDGVNGRELWQSDGTDAGTAMVRDIYPGAGSSDPAYLTAMNNKLYFAATDPVHGRELWDPPPVEGGTTYLVGPTVAPSTTEPQAEEHIAVDPSDYRNLLATVIDMSTTVPGGRQLINKYAFSSDNGETWVDSFIPIDPVTGLLPTGDGQLWSLAVDPVVAIDNGGNAYLASLYRRFEKPSALSGVYVSVTTVDSLKRLGTDPDAGFTVAQTYLVAANIDPKKNNTLEDKPWIAVDNSDSAYGGNVYLAWTHVTEGGGYDIVFSRSTDHGRTWSEPLRIGHPGGAVQGAQVAVGPDGEIYVVYGKQVVGWKNGQLFLVKSTDGGVTFSDPVSITPKFNTLSFDSTYAKYSLPALAVSPTNGNVYVVYADQPNDMVGGEVEFIISTDGGATFSAPAPLNDRSAGQQFMPAVTVDERGVIHASWFDTRNNPSGTSILDIYAAYSTDGGRTFRPNARVTATSFDVGASPFIGDYSGIAAAGGFAHPVWTTGFTPVPGGSPIGGLRTATLTTTDGSPLLAATAGPNRAPAALTSQEADSLLAEASADRPNWLDDNAAGWGWFVDPTPHNDSEFTTPGNQGERNRMDLLTVIEHEVGHMLGKDHEADGVMQETLTAGTRLAAFASSDADWLAAIDGLFAEARSKKRK